MKIIHSCIFLLKKFALLRGIGGVSKTDARDFCSLRRAERKILHELTGIFFDPTLTLSQSADFMRRKFKILSHFPRHHHHHHVSPLKHTRAHQKLTLKLNFVL
jgi:hypothetical protein